MARLKTRFDLAWHRAWAFTFGLDTCVDRGYRPATRLNTLHFPFVLLERSAIAGRRLALDGTVRKSGPWGDDRSDLGVSGPRSLGCGPPEQITSIGPGAVFRCGCVSIPGRKPAACFRVVEEEDASQNAERE